MMSAIQYFVGAEMLLFLLNMAIASCLICGLGLAALCLCRNRPAPVRHGLLLAVLVLLLFSPVLFWCAGYLGWGLGIPLATSSPSEVQHGPSGLAFWLSSETDTVSPADAPLSGEISSLPVGWSDMTIFATQAAGALLVAVWGIGTAIIFVGFLRGLATLARLRATLVAVRDPELAAAATETFRLLGIRQRVGLHHTPLTLTPFSLGLIRPRIVLPHGLAGCLNAEQLRYVLLHEAAHIRRRDHWVALLQYGCTTLFWWNPLLRGVNARLVRLREQICDDHVIAAGGSGRRFAEALVRVAEWGAIRPDVLCSAALLDHRSGARGEPNRNDLEERILRLVRKHQPAALRMSRRWQIGIAVSVLFLSVALSIARLRAADVVNESQRVTNDRIDVASYEPPVSDPKSSQTTPARDPKPQGNGWRMHLPPGFVHEVTLKFLGGNRYRLGPAWLNSSGVYELRGDRLVMVEPNDARLLGFQWEMHGDGHLALVDQPPLAKTGSNYLGAKLVPATKIAFRPTQGFWTAGGSK
jgi:beta-lactamase regulating signal transducer with metallopeptidase domain